MPCMVQKSKSKGKRQSIAQKRIQDLKDAGFIVHPKRKFIKGKKNVWLSELRTIIHKSQDQFAAMVGVSTNIIIAVENGRSPLGDNLASRIQAATGASAFHYLLGDNRPVDIAGTPYITGHFENWKKNYSGTDEQDLAEYFGYASDSLLLILKAAKECGTPNNRLPAVRRSFEQWCNGTIDSFRLKESLNAVLKRERKLVKKMTLSYGDWRLKETAGWRKFYEFKDDKRKPDSENLTLSVNVSRGWMTCGNMTVPANGVESEHFVLH